MNPIAGSDTYSPAEYACSTTNIAPTDSWQSGTTFESLTPDTTYYLFARYAGNSNSAIAWEAETGVAKGYDELTFGEKNAINREQMAAMMYKYAKACDYDLSTGKEMTFTNKANIRPWAREAMDWAISTGLLSGRTGGIADPQGAITRAEASAIKERFIRNGVGTQS